VLPSSINTPLFSHARSYDPFSYHRGSVWPVEAGTFALGLARYGCWDELHRLAEAIFAAASLFGHRVAEVLSGLPRDDFHPYPGVHPKSCSPQAWSASAIIAIVQALRGLRPIAPMRTILVDPHLPAWLPDFTLEGIRLGKARFDLAVRRDRHGGATVKTVGGDRVAVIPRPFRQARRQLRWDGYPLSGEASTLRACRMPRRRHPDDSPRQCIRARTSTCENVVSSNLPAISTARPTLSTSTM
jgi:hypothetical protein